MKGPENPTSQLLPMIKKQWAVRTREESQRRWWIDNFTKLCVKELCMMCACVKELKVEREKVLKVLCMSVNELNVKEFCGYVCVCGCVCVGVCV